MAKQIAGLCFLEGTFDDLTFYKMDGQYYVRVKSTLSSKRVKTSPEFKWTMIYARLLARASKIGSAVYNGLPPGWRQFWMYRSFTGEAFTILKENSYTDDQVKELLWKCYVEYWEQQKAADPADPIWQPKPVMVRKRRKYSPESIMRKKDKYGKPLWRNLEEEEKKRLTLEKKREWCRQQAEQEAQQTNSIPAISHPLEQEGFYILNSKSGIIHVATHKEPETPNPKPEIPSPWYVTSDGTLHTTKQNDPLSVSRSYNKVQFLLTLSTFQSANVAIVPSQSLQIQVQTVQTVFISHTSALAPSIAASASFSSENNSLILF